MNGLIDHRVVMASAGTGKTYQLTSRMIALMFEGAEPREIVATTFTRKAAGEILERVVERLVEAATDERARAGLGEAIGRDLGGERGRLACVDVLWRIASSLDCMSVLTIDALFGRMAAAMELELAASAAREMRVTGETGGTQDEGEERTDTAGGEATPGIGERRIADEAEDEALRAEALAIALDNGNDAELIALVRLLLDGHPASRMSERMLTSIRAGLSILHETQSEAGIWSVPESEDDPDVPMTQKQVRELLGQMRKLRLPPKKGGDQPDGRWVKGHTASLELAEIDAWDAFLSGGLAKASIAGTYYNAPFPPDLLAAYGVLVAHAKLMLRAQLEQRTRATRDLLVRFERVYERLKAQRGVWRFEDVPRSLLSHVKTEVLERLYYRMDARVQHLLLDEFQDTSIPSFRLIEPLIAEIVASSPPERSFFCVGDVKQSLYVWNRAEPTLLPAIAGKWEQIEKSELVESWRSSPVVLDAVNRVFGGLASNRALMAWPKVAANWKEMFKTHTAHFKDQPGEVGVHVPASSLDPKRARADSADTGGSGGNWGNGAEDQDERAMTEDAQEMVRVLVERALSRAPSASVGVLVRANAKIAPLVHALREAGIHASEEGGSSLYDTMPVGVVRSAFQLAQHPGDSAALFHVAASPLGKMLGIELGIELGGEAAGSAEVGAGGVERRTTWRSGIEQGARRVGEMLRRRVGRDGLAQTVAWLVRGIGASTDARGLRRLEQVIELARRVDEIPGAGIGSFIDALDRERMKDPGASGVRVMTIHASKGLEFDVVILADLDGKMVGTGSPLVVDRLSPLDKIRHVMCKPSKGMLEAEPHLAAIVRRSTERTLVEGLCVLYVAMTRARYSLQIVLGPRSIKEGDASSETVYPGRLIAAALADNWPEITEAGTVFERSSGDWGSVVSARDRAGTIRDDEPERVAFVLRSAPAQERSTARLARVSPSSLEGGETRTLAEVLRPASDAGRLRGTMLHGMFELVGWIEDGEPTPEELMARGHSLGADEIGAHTATDAVRRAMMAPEIRRALSRASIELGSGETLELWRERRFAVRSVRSDGEPVLLNGQFDRVVVVRDSEGRPARALLQDFKTDDVKGEEMLGGRVEHYTPQIEAYRTAIATMLGLARSRVGAMLLFTEIGRVVEIGGNGG